MPSYLLQRIHRRSREGDDKYNIHAVLQDGIALFDPCDILGGVEALEAAEGILCRVVANWWATC